MKYKHFKQALLFKVGSVIKIDKLSLNRIKLCHYDVPFFKQGTLIDRNFKKKLSFCKNYV